MLALLLFGGLRLSEATAITCDDLDLEFGGSWLLLLRLLNI
jgi:integrase